MDLNNYGENYGKTSIFVIVPTVLKREIKEDIEFVLKAKPQISNALLIQHLFDFMTVDCCIQLKTAKILKI